jgi:hypothetical protein
MAMVSLVTLVLLIASPGLPLPKGPEPEPVPLPHFPRQLDAFVFRNWDQARFVLERRKYRAATEQKDPQAALLHLAELEKTAREEESSARRLLRIVSEDSRLGFEASNQYYYLPVDLLEKILSCRWLAESWVPGEAKRWKTSE